MRHFVRVAILAIIGTQMGFGVTIGQTDTFDDGIFTWFAGGGPMGQVPPSPPAVIEDGGPAGAGDAFMWVTSVGGPGAGNRLVVMNAAQWAGNYLMAGIGAIEADVINLGQTDLTLRLYFEDPIPGPPQNEAVSTSGVNLPAGSGWQHVVFPISASSLTVLQGDLNTLLGATTILRIFSGLDADFPPGPLVGQLGINNIRAVSTVPEPAAFWIAAFGLGTLAICTRLRKVR